MRFFLTDFPATSLAVLLSLHLRRIAHARNGCACLVLCTELEAVLDVLSENQRSDTYAHWN